MKKELVSIFRFEHYDFEEPTGPYQGNGHLWDHHYDGAGQPEPHQDWDEDGTQSSNPYGFKMDLFDKEIIDDYNGRVLFGFKSLKQAYDWFSKDDMNILLKLGCKLVRYEVPIELVCFKEKQVMFFQFNG